MADETKLQVASKELAILRPAEERVKGLERLFLPAFKWQKDSLEELEKIKSTISKFEIEKPNKLHLPMLKELDDKITELKKLKTTSKNSRLDHTKNFDIIKKRFMVIEEAYEEMEIAVTSTFKKIKIIEFEENAVKQRRQDDLASFRTLCQKNYNEQAAAWMLLLNEKITDLYKDAIELIEPGSELVAYLNHFQWKYTARTFNHKVPKFSDAELEDKEKMVIYYDVFAPWEEKRRELEKYVIDSLGQKFIGFAIAKKNATTAVAASEFESAMIADEIKEEAETSNAIAEIEEKAGTYVQEEIQEKTRDLKKIFKIETENTVAFLKSIDKAFYANLNDCLKTYKGKDFLKIDAYSKISMLCNLKNADNGFTVTGIEFIEDTKI